MTVTKVTANGFCFLNAVLTCLLHDHMEVYTINSLQEKITSHLLQHADHYKEWHGSASADKLVYEATQFFNDRKFQEDIVDIVVQATADVLQLKLNIYQKSLAGYIQILVVECENATREINLKFTTGATPRNPLYTGANHYDAIILVDRGVHSSKLITTVTRRLML